MLNLTSALFINAAASAARQKTLAEKYKLNPTYVGICADCDPTPNGTYTEWLIKMVAKRHLPIDEVSSVTEMLTNYHRLKNSPTFTYSKDINSYTTPQQLFDVVNTTLESSLSKNEQERELQRRKQEYLDAGCTYLGNPREGMMCFQPNEARAAALLAEGSHWCTKNVGIAQSYLSRGSIYVFVTEDEESNSQYGSDRYAQLYVPHEDVNRFELEDVNGRDLYSDEEAGYLKHIDDMAWWMIEWMCQHDNTLNKWVQSGFIFNDWDDAATIKRCDECGFRFNTHYYSTDGHTFCDEGCMWSFFKEDVYAKVEELMAEVERPEVEEAMQEFEQMAWDLQSPNPDAVKVFTAIRDAAVRKGITNADATDPNFGTTKFPMDWYTTTLNSAMKCSDEGLEAVLPGITREEVSMAKDLLCSIDNRASWDLEKANQYVRDNFEGNLDEIKGLLQGGGFLPPAKEEAVKTSSLLAPTEQEDPLDQTVQKLLSDYVFEKGQPDQTVGETQPTQTAWEIEPSDMPQAEPTNKTILVIVTPVWIKDAPPLEQTSYVSGEDQPVYQLAVNAHLSKSAVLGQKIAKHQPRQMAEPLLIPSKTRSLTAELIDEYSQKGNGLVSSFLKGSEVWSRIATTVNSQTKRQILNDLNKEAARISDVKMGDGSPD